MKIILDNHIKSESLFEEIINRFSDLRFSLILIWPIIFIISTIIILYIKLLSPINNNLKIIPSVLILFNYYTEIFEYWLFFDKKTLITQKITSRIFLIFFAFSIIWGFKVEPNKKNISEISALFILIYGYIRLWFSYQIDDKILTSKKELLNLLNEKKIYKHFSDYSKVLINERFCCKAKSFKYNKDVLKLINKFPNTRSQEMTNELIEFYDYKLKKLKNPNEYYYLSPNSIIQYRTNLLIIKKMSTINYERGKFESI